MDKMEDYFEGNYDFEEWKIEKEIERSYYEQNEMNGYDFEVEYDFEEWEIEESYFKQNDMNGYCFEDYNHIVRVYDGYSLVYSVNYEKTGAVVKRIENISKSNLDIVIPEYITVNRKNFNVDVTGCNFSNNSELKSMKLIVHSTFDDHWMVYAVDIEKGYASVTGIRDIPRNITIPEYITLNNKKFNVEVISRSVFESCTTLESIECSNVIEIGDYAFWDCESLESIECPNVKEIGDRAFENCKSLESIECPNVNNIGDNSFLCCLKLASIKCPKVREIGNRAFLCCSLLASIECPDVKKIGDKAFWCCKSLKSIKLLKAETIGEKAFEDCTSLESLYCPNAKKIGYRAFKGHIKGCELIERQKRTERIFKGKDYDPWKTGELSLEPYSEFDDE